MLMVNILLRFVVTVFKKPWTADLGGVFVLTLYLPAPGSVVGSCPQP